MTPLPISSVDYAAATICTCIVCVYTFFALSLGRVLVYEQNYSKYFEAIVIVVQQIVYNIFITILGQLLLKILQNNIIHNTLG